MDEIALPVLAELPSEPRWILQSIAGDGARMRSAPDWASVSAFHHLLTNGVDSHPGYGVALLQWQRVQARFGAKAAEWARAGFLGLQRSDPSVGYAARILELWCHMVPLELDGRERMEALERLPALEAALVAEEIAIGAYERGVPASRGILERFAGPEGSRWPEAQVLAILQIAARDQLAPPNLAAVLAPPLYGLPGPCTEVLWRLVAGDASGGVAPQSLPITEVVREIRLKAAATPADSPLAAVASQILGNVRVLREDEVVALSRWEKGLSPVVRAALPPVSRMEGPVAVLDADHAERLGRRFPSLSGLVERVHRIPGLAARVSQEVRKRGSAAKEPLLELETSLRTGAPLARDQIQAWRGAVPGLEWVIFDSPSGPGLLQADGTLTNGLRDWQAPHILFVAHPVHMNPAERGAWQTRVGLRPTPLNQIFREIHNPSGQEASRRRLVRFRQARLTFDSLELLARRSWSPHVCPLDIAPELALGEERVRLRVTEGPAGLQFDGLEFLDARGEPLLISDVHRRTFSEAWRDIDEAIALSSSEPSWVPSHSRAELVRALAPSLQGRIRRVEKDHVSVQRGSVPVQVTLHNAQAASGLPAEGPARARSRGLLPFEDDGGVAAVLIGRLALLLEDSGETG